MDVILSTPKKELYRGKAVSVTLPGEEGIMQILPGHAPLLSLLAAGNVVIDSGSGASEFKVSSGFAEAHDNKITILLRDG